MLCGLPVTWSQHSEIIGSDIGCQHLSETVRTCSWMSDYGGHVMSHVSSSWAMCVGVGTRVCRKIEAFVVVLIPFVSEVGMS